MVQGWGRRPGPREGGPPLSTPSSPLCWALLGQGCGWRTRAFISWGLPRVSTLPSCVQEAHHGRASASPQEKPPHGVPETQARVLGAGGLFQMIPPEARWSAGVVSRGGLWVQRAAGSDCPGMLSSPASAWMPSGPRAGPAQPCLASVKGSGLPAVCVVTPDAPLLLAGVVRVTGLGAVSLPYAGSPKDWGLRGPYAVTVVRVPRSGLGCQG